VFKTLATNPSKLVSQTAKLKYYLPPEVEEEHVIEADPGLEVKYDVERDQMYVEGEFELAAGEGVALARLDELEPDHGVGVAVDLDLEAVAEVRGGVGGHDGSPGWS